MKARILCLIASLFCSVNSTAEIGGASLYADKFQGRKTASGEAFDQENMTAAHKTLPFQTLVLVEHLENHQTVAVRINDRGPFIRGRIIDLSRAAAEKLGIIREGHAPVYIEVIWGVP